MGNEQNNVMPAGWRVKPLVWSAANEAGHGRAHYGSGVFGHWYAISRSKYKCWMVVHHIVGKAVHMVPFVSLEDAKTAAQADYERRIFAALEPIPEEQP